MVKITPIQQRMLDILKNNGGTVTGAANLGFLMWPNGKNTASRWPQGVALAASRIAKQLKDAGLIASFGQPTTFKLKAFK